MRKRTIMLAAGGVNSRPGIAGNGRCSAALLGAVRSRPRRYARMRTGPQLRHLQAIRLRNRVVTPCSKRVVSSRRLPGIPVRHRVLLLLQEL